MEEIITNEIQIYQFPTTDESVADLNQKMNVRGREREKERERDERKMSGR